MQGKNKEDGTPETMIIVNRSHAGGRVILTGIGEVEVSTDGEVEVSVDLAEQMLALGSGWRNADDAAKTDDLKASLAVMTLEQLVDLADKSDIPAKDYEKMKINATLMQRFLTKRLATAQS